ncbi:hypothetical protein [Flavobacterium davisii]|uniref:Uncharacterized protein n=1 Tax=Flavobacterium columnare TaxID=996 RepID=A0A8G0KT91_9FLAO|nr:hypothetical protein [Flavobacterium davisii]QYS88573.1 hypothetical protein JJC05_13220 [Flavobacterium davisii]
MKKLHAIVSNLKLAVEYSETTMKLFDNIKNKFNPDYADYPINFAF